MKHYKIVSPDLDYNPIEEIYSEREIISYYFDWWSEKMSKIGKSHLISYENCIEDWVSDNGATEVL